MSSSTDPARIKLKEEKLAIREAAAAAKQPYQWNVQTPAEKAYLEEKAKAAAASSGPKGGRKSRKSKRRLMKKKSTRKHKGY